MSHTPFIFASYAITAVFLVWCAFAPLVHAKKLKEAIIQRSQLKGEDHASGS